MVHAKTVEVLKEQKEEAEKDAAAWGLCLVFSAIAAAFCLVGFCECEEKAKHFGAALNHLE